MFSTRPDFGSDCSSPAHVWLRRSVCVANAIPSDPQENVQMKSNVMLTIASMLSIVLFGSHWAYEVAHGWETGGLAGLGGVLIMVVWLYGTLVLTERRSGQIIMLIGAILSFGVLVLHRSEERRVGN